MNLGRLRPDDNDAVEAVAADLTALGLAVEETIAIGSRLRELSRLGCCGWNSTQMRRRFVVWVDAGDGDERHVVWCIEYVRW